MDVPVRPRTLVALAAAVLATSGGVVATTSTSDSDASSATAHPRVVEVTWTRPASDALLQKLIDARIRKHMYLDRAFDAMVP